MGNTNIRMFVDIRFERKDESDEARYLEREMNRLIQDAEFFDHAMSSVITMMEDYLKTEDEYRKLRTVKVLDV